MDPSPDYAQRSLPRLLARVERAPNGCWNWTGSTRRAGYGQIYAGRAHGKQIVCRAHRFSWIAHNGAIPGGLSVCHHCDNPRCINPDHLFLGTHQQNMADCRSKGRLNILDGSLARGTLNVNAKLTPSDVAAIRARRRAGEKGVCLAADFGVTPQTISHIVRGQTWALDASESRNIPEDRARRSQEWRKSGGN